MTRRPIDEQLMTDFLLGNLPEEEIERLDEMSLADDDFANRLQAVDNDLVDAYVRGELSGTSLSRFKSNYLRSAKRRETVEFAETLQKQLNKPSHVKRPLEFQATQRAKFIWLAVAAAVVIVSFLGYLAFENIRLQDQVRELQAEKESSREREQQLQKQIAELKQPPGISKSEDVKLMAFVLLPQTRGINKIPVISLPSDTDYLALTLKMEINDFPDYMAKLKDPATNELIWRSGNLKADKDNLVEISVPATAFKSQNYFLELTGISKSGAAEVVSSYPFRIAKQ
jgi:hypothetical protein